MSRSRLLLVACITISFAVTAMAFRASRTTTAPSGSVTSAMPMLEPRSGHSATLLPDGKVLIAGGMRRNQDFYSSAELYDPATGKFQKTGEMHERRVGQIAVLLPRERFLSPADGSGWAARIQPSYMTRQQASSP